MTDSPTQPAKPTWFGTLLRPKVALPLTGLILLLLSPLLIRGWNLSHVPDLEDAGRQHRTTPAAPNDDSALKHFRKAAELGTEPKYEYPEDILADSLSGKDISLEDVTAWQVRFGNPPSLPVRWFQSKYHRFITAEQLTTYLAANAEALREFREATDIRMPPTGELLEFLGQYDTAVRFDHLCALSMLQSERAQLDGDLAASWNNLRSVFRFRQLLTFLYVHTVASNYEFGRYAPTDRFEQLMKSPDLTPELFRTVIDDLAEIRDSAADLEWRMDVSYRETRDYVASSAKRVTSRYELAEAGSSIEAGSSATGNSSARLFMQGEPELSLRLLKQHDTWLRLWFDHGGKFQAVRSTYPYIDAPIPGLAPESDDLLPAAEVVEAIKTRAVLLPSGVLDQPLWAVDIHTELLYFELLRIQAAGKWYAFVHDTPPARVVDLVPDYLPALPVDPFSPTGEPLTLEGPDWEHRDRLNGDIAMEWNYLFWELCRKYRY